MPHQYLPNENINTINEIHTSKFISFEVSSTCGTFAYFTMKKIDKKKEKRYSSYELCS